MTTIAQRIADDTRHAEQMRLVAVAPELLAVLQEAVNKGYMWDNDPELWSKASAAIDKAKGE